MMNLLALSILNSGVPLSMVCAVIGLAFAFFLIAAVLQAPSGNERMREISAAVQEGARAYLNRQVKTVSVIAVIIFILFFVFKDHSTAIGFVIGAFCSLAAGFIGMRVAVLANVRTAQAAGASKLKALRMGFNGGSVTGLLVVGLALLSVSIFYTVAAKLIGSDAAIRSLVGLALGRSLISVFARLGGGIFTKAADVGADLVGKIEAGIPEDDPRNPAVIADNVGDNVGDCAGMAADLFETYAVTSVAVMLLGVLTFNQQAAVAMYPLILGAVAIIASIIGTFAVKSAAGNVERALYQGLIVSGVLAALAFLPVTYWLMHNVTLKSGAAAPHWWKFYLCALIGVGITASLFMITDYFTSTRFAPVKSTARASQTGHATNIIQGLAQGFQATAPPAIVVAVGILGAWKLAGGGGTT